MGIHIPAIPLSIILFALTVSNAQEVARNQDSSNVRNFTQYTPDLADWSTFYSKAIDDRFIDHTPDAIWWLDRSKWVEWDGVPIDTTLPHKTFADTICPSGDTILGLREVFYKYNSFSDPKHPTKAEVDEWHRLALVHIRRLVGSTTPIEPDHCLFARALWGQQRRFTRQWDEKYPDGTCEGDTTGHSGATFLPSDEDQVPYLPPGHPPCRWSGGGSDGTSSATKSGILWSIKFVRVFCYYLHSEGFNGGHVGPYFGRTRFGWSFWDNNPGKANNNALFRGKWGGTVIRFTPPVTALPSPSNAYVAGVVPLISASTSYSVNPPYTSTNSPSMTKAQSPSPSSSVSHSVSASQPASFSAGPSSSQTPKRTPTATPSEATTPTASATSSNSAKASSTVSPSLSVVQSSSPIASASTSTDFVISSSSAPSVTWSTGPSISPSISYIAPSSMSVTASKSVSVSPSPSTSLLFSNSPTSSASIMASSTSIVSISPSVSTSGRPQSGTCTEMLKRSQSFKCFNKRRIHLSSLQNGATMKTFLRIRRGKIRVILRLSSSIAGNKFRFTKVILLATMNGTISSREDLTTVADVKAIRGRRKGYGRTFFVDDFEALDRGRCCGKALNVYVYSNIRQYRPRNVIVGRDQQTFIKAAINLSCTICNRNLFQCRPLEDVLDVWARNYD